MNARRRILPAIECVAASIALLAAISACSRSPADSAEGSFVLALPATDFAKPVDPPPRLLPDQLPVLEPDPPQEIFGPASGSPNDGLHQALDALSWRTFVALNWPALPDGRPDRAQVPGQHGDNLTTWSNWPSEARLRLGEEPPAASASPEPSRFGATLSEALQTLPPGARVLTRVATLPGLLTDLSETAFNGPLIDQNGRYARSETLVNHPLLSALRAQKGENPDPALELPDPSRFLSPEAKNASIQGAVLVRAAWKILSPDEIEAGRFHASPALIYTPPTTEPPAPERIEKATVGLVGLHLAYQTAANAAWVWSVFEHVDNCPTVGEPADRAAYNFYNKAASHAPANIPPELPWDPSVVEPPSRRPQLVRQTPIEASARALNAAYQAALRAVNPASVWQYYQLVSTRQPSSSEPAAPFGGSSRLLTDARR